MTEGNLLLSLVMAWIVPPVVEVINKKLTLDLHKKIAAFLVSVFVGLVASTPQLSKNPMDVNSWFVNAGIVLAASQTYYAMIWKKSDIQKYMKK